MQQDIVGQGVELMLYGMGTVVVFLALLVVATTLMSAFVGRYFPDAEKVTVAAGKSSSAPADNELVAVISAAVHQHRKRK